LSNIASFIARLSRTLKITKLAAGKSKKSFKHFYSISIKIKISPNEIVLLNRCAKKLIAIFE
jgi:hypothetical protein